MSYHFGSTFIPPWWLRNPHGQTLWQNVLRRCPLPATRAERLELPDGDFVDLHWTLRDSGPIVVVLHGLQGSLRSIYARGLLRALDEHGWRAVFMHFRGCSGAPNRLPRFYHAGDTGDLNVLIDTLRAREPGTPLAAVGFSLGGNVLLKWLGEQGERAPLACAAAVSVPFDLSDAAARFERGFSRFYQWHLLRCLRRSIREKFNRGTASLFGDLARLRTMREYDDKIAAPLHGFAGADDYYAKSSSRQYLRHIRTPTLIVHALDDPFMTERAVPRPNELSDSITFELSRHGGHVGFVTGGYPWRPQYWLEQRVPDYLASMLG